MIYLVSKENKVLQGNIQLTASKSESNRVLIIQALCKEGFNIFNLSDSDDTLILQKLLKSDSKELTAGAAGTTFRFLTALLAASPGEWVLTGSDRMQQRPIGILVDALIKLGAEIQYLNKEGYPPLKITGKRLKGGKLVIESSVSSQYISALLLISPVVEDGLNLILQGNITSEPYIELTLNLMKHFGIKYEFNRKTIMVPEQRYIPKDITIEGDWSAASYWYEMAAFAENVNLTIPSLKHNSLQGDAIISEIMKQFGIKTEYLENGIRLSKKNISTNDFLFEHDFTKNPDLAQTLILTCAGLGIEFMIKGLHTLSLKETDRIEALKNELRKINKTLKKKEIALQ